MTSEIKNAIISLTNLQHVKHSSLEECQETFALIEDCQFFLRYLKTNTLKDKCWFANDLMKKIFKDASVNKLKNSKHSNILEDEKTTSSLKSILDVLFAKVQDKDKIDSRMLLYSASTYFSSKDLILEFFLKETPYMLAISLPFPDSISMLVNQNRLSSQICLGVSQVVLHAISYNNNVDIDFDLKFLQDLLAYYVCSGDLNSFLKRLDDRQLKEVQCKDDDF